MTFVLILLGLCLNLAHAIDSNCKLHIVDVVLKKGHFILLRAHFNYVNLHVARDISTQLTILQNIPVE